MELVLLKFIVFSKTRLRTKCLTCRRQIILDSEVFTEQPATVFCDKCSSVFSILKIEENKKTLRVECFKSDELDQKNFFGPL